LCGETTASDGVSRSCMFVCLYVCKYARLVYISDLIKLTHCVQFLKFSWPMMSCLFVCVLMCACYLYACMHEYVLMRVCMHARCVVGEEKSRVGVVTGCKNDSYEYIDINKYTHVSNHRSACSCLMYTISHVMYTISHAANLRVWASNDSQIREIICQICFVKTPFFCRALLQRGL